MEGSASAFYAWVKKFGETDRIMKKVVLEAKARQFFYEHKQTYGYRWLSDTLGKMGYLLSTPFNGSSGV